MTTSTTRPASDYPPGGDAFRHRHLTGIAPLTPWEISYVLDAAEEWVELNRRSEEHTSELQSLMRISYAVFCLKKKTKEKYINKRQSYSHTTPRTQHNHRRSE